MAKGTYVDGFVIPIPKKNTAKYKKMAQEGAKIWKQFGALEYKECILDDPNQPHVKFTFPKMAKAKSGETVWFSFIVFKSRQHRDAVNSARDRRKTAYSRRLGQLGVQLVGPALGAHRRTPPRSVRGAGRKTKPL